MFSCIDQPYSLFSIQFVKTEPVENLGMVVLVAVLDNFDTYH